ncbi:MAG: phenylalanine--tRNA ligase subunit beta [Candidatus Sulfotelmatobacter sp.]
MKLSANWIRDYVDLHVDDNHLASDLTDVGFGVEGIEGHGADAVFEVEIGTNRPDAMNHYGVAREAAAIYDLPLKELSALRHQPSANASTPFPITVEEPELCPRFTARVLQNTKITSSPEKVAHRLQRLDQRPISNAVDATNYVLWEIGKPTHVFDADLLEGGRIIVRKARAGETLKTLDGVDRKLTTEDLVVCDVKKPVGLAGVMGGYDTMITVKTRNIVIESAWWDPGIVRKMSRRHAIHTDASHRFERGADFESTVLSCDLVAEMILSSGGGELVGDVVDVVSKRMDQAPVVLHVSEVQRILGRSLDAGQIFRLLKRLGFILIPEGQPETQGDQQFRVQIPSWRLDVEREIDLIEEIARLHGYNKFPNTLPAYSGAVIELPQAKIDNTVRERALALGYNEALSLTFISYTDAEKFSSATGNQVLELENPLSEEASVMRTSLAPGMLDMLAWNVNRDVAEARLFEMGSIYEMQNGERIEPRCACLGATMAAVRASLPISGAVDVSKGEHALAAEAFRGFKGDVESLLAAFACHIHYDRAAAEYFHPGRSARALVNGQPVAQFGQVHPEVAAARKLRQDVFLAEFDLDQLYQMGLRPARFVPLPKYPVVDRDFSFVFADDVAFEQMQQAIAALHIHELKEFSPVEIFRGGSIAAGKYSVLLRVLFQSSDRTLREDEIAQWSAKVVAALTALGGTQRA